MAPCPLAGRSLHRCAPLPFVRNDYFQDFTNADEEAAFDYLIARCDAVFELDGSRRDEPEAYEVAGLTVLRQSDVLLAVWDGDLSRGRGGTAEIIRATYGGWAPADVAFSILATPRLLLYQLMTLTAGLRSPADERKRKGDRTPAETGEPSAPA